MRHKWGYISHMIWKQNLRMYLEDKLSHKHPNSRKLFLSTIHIIWFRYKYHNLYRKVDKLLVIEGIVHLGILAYKLSLMLITNQGCTINKSWYQHLYMLHKLDHIVHKHLLCCNNLLCRPHYMSYSTVQGLDCNLYILERLNIEHSCLNICHTVLS